VIRLVRILLIGLAALMFAGAAVARAAPPPGERPPCHQAIMNMGGRHGPATPARPAPAMMSMDCCQACLPSLAIPQAMGTPVRRPTEIAFATKAGRLEGRVLTPEPAPPRTA